jgi:hypothetical protein
LCAAFAVFQACLVAGLPLGAAAWGGAQDDLGPGLRLASAAAAVLFAAAFLVVLRRGGYAVWSPLSDRHARFAAWVIAGYAVLGVLGNLASHSSVERAVMAPTAAALAVSCLIVAAWGGSAHESEGRRS